MCLKELRIAVEFKVVLKAVSFWYTAFLAGNFLGNNRVYNK